ncbi:AAA family ATPase [Okeania sp. SIO1F9]|uniref:AAA family ATPase n=1 Tax=Okeania sp. SIO1F9 TaxID=2607813 RepID=UPI00144F0F75|nr:AAA family ATPase [Okeania sp. SIO1F9]NET79723.1 AAA family ATPase [Okeania sp. SIO1F9]NET79735.1 AAA family ATPase [Okeania sp. SIO1F9]
MINIAQNPNLFQVTSQSLSTKNFLIDLEIEIIGGLIIDCHAIYRINDELKSEYFSTQGHKKIIQCIKDLHNQGKIPDLNAVTLEMMNRGELELIGGRVGIANYLKSTVSATNIDQHLQLLIENYNRSDYFDSGKLKPSPAINRIKEIYNSDRSPEQIQLDLLDLQEETGMSDRKWYEFSRNAIREGKKIRYKLDITRLSGITNQLDRSIEIDAIAEIYRKSRKTIESDILTLESPTMEMVNTSGGLPLLSFLDREPEMIDWIYPGLLPKGELLLLAAEPKVGKTLFATDIMYAHLTGTSLYGNPIPKGKILYYHDDESEASVRRKLFARGFDLLDRETQKDMFIASGLRLDNLQSLEKQLETFRPTLVVIDSLSAIARNLGVSENEAAFAKHIYKMRDLFSKYGAACILIHHENKSREAVGINKVAGSSRITAAAWGIAQMKSLVKKDDDDNSKNNIRLLKITPREGSVQNLMFEMQPSDTWLDQSIFKYIGEGDDKDNKKQDQSLKLLDFLTNNKGTAFTVEELKEKFGSSNYIYEVLNRLEDQSQIIRCRDKIKKRRYVYLVPDNTKSDLCATNPPPVKTKPETEITETEITENKIHQDIQTFRLDSDLIQRDETPLKQDLKQENTDESKDSGDNKELIQVSGLDLDTPPSPHIDATVQEHVVQNPDRQNTPNNVNGQDDLKVGDKVIELGNCE